MCLYRYSIPCLPLLLHSISISIPIHSVKARKADWTTVSSSCPSPTSPISDSQAYSTQYTALPQTWPSAQCTRPSSRTSIKRWQHTSQRMYCSSVRIGWVDGAVMGWCNWTMMLMISYQCSCSLARCARSFACSAVQCQTRRTADRREAQHCSG